MHCQQFEARINDLLDQRRMPSSDPIVHGHAERCGRCADLLATYESMIVGLAQIPEPELENDLSVLVGAQLLQSPPVAELVLESHEVPRIRLAIRRGARWVAWLRPLFTLAAGVLIVVGVYRVLPIRSTGDKSTVGATADKAAGTMAGQTAGTVQMPPSAVATVKPHVRATSANAGQRMIASAPPVNSGVAVDHYSQLAVEAEQIAQRQMAVASEVADGLRPVADSMSAAINVLRRPPPRTERPNGSGAQMDGQPSSQSSA